MHKRGVSEIVSYVLLISITLVLAGLVFAWLRFQVTPSDGIECEAGVSLSIKSYVYNCSTQSLNLTLQNNGLFDIEGYITRVNNISASSKIGVVTLNRTGKEIILGESHSDFYPNMASLVNGRVYFVEVQPLVVRDNKSIYCKNIIVKQNLKCSGAAVCVDLDGDGYNSTGGICGPIDCRDNDNLIHPFATEVCDEEDNDCDGTADEGVTTTFYLDNDSDGYGNFSVTSVGCLPAPLGYVEDHTDCNDSNATIHPGATEACDGIDNNCIGGTDEGCECTTGFFRPCGYSEIGVCSDGTQTCNILGKWADCVGQVLPSAEVCDGLDNNCDDFTDEGCDDDNDNYCDSSMTTISTPAICPYGGGDCDDTPNSNQAFSTHPNAPELCTMTGVDENCDGFAGDCGASEFCNPGNVCTPKWVYQENAISYSAFDSGYFDINYSVPAGALPSSKWLVKHGSVTENISLNAPGQNCWGNQPLMFRVTTNATFSYWKGHGNRLVSTSDLACYLGGGIWAVIGTEYLTTGGDMTSYEFDIADSNSPIKYNDGNWSSYNVRLHDRLSGAPNYWVEFLTAAPATTDEPPKIYEEAMWWNFG